MASGQFQNLKGISRTGRATASCMALKVRDAEGAAAGNAEWIEKQIWQCAEVLASGWECATCTVAPQTSNSTQPMANHRRQPPALFSTCRCVRRKCIPFL